MLALWSGEEKPAPPAAVRVQSGASATVWCRAVPLHAGAQRGVAYRRGYRRHTPHLRPGGHEPTVRADGPEENGRLWEPSAGRSSDDTEDLAALRAWRAAPISAGRLLEGPQRATHRLGPAGRGRGADPAAWACLGLLSPPGGHRGLSPVLSDPLMSGFFYLKRKRGRMPGTGRR